MPTPAAAAGPPKPGLHMEHVQQELLCWDYFQLVAERPADGAARLMGIKALLRYNGLGQFCTTFKALLLEELRADMVQQHEQLAAGATPLAWSKLRVASLARTSSMYTVTMAVEEEDNRCVAWGQAGTAGVVACEGICLQPITHACWLSTPSPQAMPGSTTSSHTAPLLSPRRSSLRGEDLLLLVKAPITEASKMRSPPAVHVLALVTELANEQGGRTLTARLAPGSMCGLRACRPEALLSAGSTWHALTVAQLTTHMRWVQQR